MALQPGTRLGHYEITSLLGSGGMGEVYRAKDEHLSRDVAIKVLPTGTLADEHVRQRFRKEALALSKLNHPNIATVHDFDTQAGVDFIVMELVEGVSLAAKVKTGPLPEKEISALGSQIADALEEAHESEIIHRDLKPGNIVVTPKGRVKVLDFGLAKMLRPVSDEATTEALTQEHAVAGTLPYMSPEELRGEKADQRSDLFSFGVVLYELATGRRPFEHTISTALADAIIHKPPEPPSTHNRKVSPGLEAIITKALDKNPEHRYQSAREMRVDLERLTAPVSGTVPERRETLRRWLWVAGAVAVIALLATLAYWLVGGGDAPKIESIAVLPLENMSGDPEQEYFSDGLTDALINELAQIGSIKVISRTSVMQYKGTRTPLPEIAKELNVMGIVEGSVLREGERVAVTAQLIDAAKDEHLWSQSFERDLRDFITLRKELAQAIAAEIRAELTPEMKARLAERKPVNPQAQEAFLKAMWYTDNARSFPEFESCLERFQKVIDIDPGFAPAYIEMASLYGTLGFNSYLPPQDAYGRAKELANKALELDDSFYETHLILASTHSYEWDWAAAELARRRAAELNPNLKFALWLRLRGHYEEAIQAVKYLIEVNPKSLGPRHSLAWAYFVASRYDEAIAQAKEVLEAQPAMTFTHIILGWSYAFKGMHAEAVASCDKGRELHPPGANIRGDSGCAYVYSLAGDREKAQKILDEWMNLSQERFVDPYYIARMHLAAANVEKTFEWLEKAYQEHTVGMVGLKEDRWLDTIRDDPRFQDLMRRMNFPE